MKTVENQGKLEKILQRKKNIQKIRKGETLEIKYQILQVYC